MAWNPFKGDSRLTVQEGRNSIRPSARFSTSASSTRIPRSSSSVQGDGQRHRPSNTSSTGNFPGVLDLAGGDPDEGEEEEERELRNDSSSVINFYPVWCRCVKCLQRDNVYDSDSSTSWGDCIRNLFLCPPQGTCARTLTFLLLCGMGWLFAWFLLHEIGPDPHIPVGKSPASVRGPITALFILEVVGLFVGISMKICRLPSLLGPLILGIFLRNIPPLNLYKQFEWWEFRNCETLSKNASVECARKAVETSSHWIQPIRQIALTMILTRAGLELSPKQLKKLSMVVPCLAFGPCLVEACTCAGVTFVLFNVLVPDNDKISIYMCFVAGFALAAVSPAVVVPGMLSLKKKNYGVGQGIPTLLIAASSIDDVLAISLYTIFLGLAITPKGEESAPLGPYAPGPLSIVVGIIHGIIVGPILHFIPSKDSQHKAKVRLSLLLLVNLSSIFIYEYTEILSGAGSLAVLMTSLIASFGWRSQPHWKRPMKQIEKTMALLWTLCVPLLFGTIGREMDFSKMRIEVAGKLLAAIAICLTIRCTTAGLIVRCMMKLSFKESLFCALAWIPKATVQAALAPLVVSKIQARPDLVGEKEERHGDIVVALAVLGILITAPLGSILIAFFGPRLLRQATKEEVNEFTEEFPDGEGLDPAEIEEIELVVTASRTRQLGKGSTDLPDAPIKGHEKDKKQEDLLSPPPAVLPKGGLHNRFLASVPFIMFSPEELGPKPKPKEPKASSSSEEEAKTQSLTPTEDKKQSLPASEEDKKKSAAAPEKLSFGLFDDSPAGSTDSITKDQN